MPYDKLDYDYQKAKVVIDPSQGSGLDAGAKKAQELAERNDAEIDNLQQGTGVTEYDKRGGTEALP